MEEQPAMATSLRSLTLLILVASQGCIAQADTQEAMVITAMKGVSESLECLGDTVKVFDGLPNLVTKLTQDVLEMKTQLDNKLKTEKSLNEYIDELKHRITVKDTQMELLTERNAEQKVELASKDEKVEELDRKFQESQRRVQLLENIVHELNQTLQANESEARRSECFQPPEVKELVQEFGRTREWNKLKRGLSDVLDQSSEPYKQLETIFYFSIYPLYWVGYENKSQLASLLLCGELPVDSADSDGDTMLEGAARGGHLELVRMLLEHGADVNKRVSANSTPLIGAASEGHLEVVRTLVQAGADTEAKDSEYHTALDKARSENKADVVDYLEHLPAQ